MEKQIIYIWLDFISPLSYVTYTNLWKAINELQRRDLMVDIKTYQLDPEFDNYDDIQVKEAKKEMKKVKKLMESSKVSTIVKESNINFNWKAEPINTVHPHRLLQLAKTYDDDHSIANDLTRMLFSAYWIKNRDISQQEELVKIAISAGLDEKSSISVFDTDKYLEMLFLDEQEGIDQGIHGAPFLAFPNGEKVSGLLSTKQLKDYINKIPTLVDEEETTEEK